MIRKIILSILIIILAIGLISEIFANQLSSEPRTLMDPLEINLSENLEGHLLNFYMDKKKEWYFAAALGLVGFGAPFYYTIDFWGYGLPFAAIDGLCMYGLINSAYHDQNIGLELGIFFGSRVLQMGLSVLATYIFNRNLMADIENSFGTQFDLSYGYNPIYEQNRFTFSMRF